MATFYIQLEDRLQKISGDLTHDNIVRALGYTPSDFSGNFNDLEDNPLTQDGNGEFKIVDESGNIIAIVDSEGIHSIDFVAGDHKLSDKADKNWVTEFVTETVTEGKVNLDGYATESWVENKGYAKQEDLDNIDFNTLKNTPFSDDENGELNIVDENNNIGLRLNGDGLYVKDVIAGDNILSNKADKSDLEGLATESYVVTKIAEAKLEGSDISIPVQDVKVNGQTVIKDMVAEIDLTPYAKSEDVPSIEGLATEQWVTNKNYLTQHQDISHLATKEELSNKMDITDNLVRVEDTDGELDDVPEDVCVKYVTQSLTEEQKNQVRENLGIPSMEYVLSLFEQLKQMIENNNASDAIAVLDSAILDLHKLQ